MNNNNNTPVYAIDTKDMIKCCRFKQESETILNEAQQESETILNEALNEAHG